MNENLDKATMITKGNFFIVVFIMVNFLLSSFYIDTWINANTTSRALPIITYYEQGTFRIDKYHELTCDKSHINGHYYTDKAPLPTLVVMPFFGLMVKSGIVKANHEGSLFGNHIYLLGGILIGTIPFVLVILITFFSISPFKSPVSPVILAMMPFYASFLFVFAGSYFAHLFAGILLLASYLFLKKEKYILSGFFAGLTFITEYNLAVVFMVWVMLMVYKTRQYTPVIRFTAGSLPTLIFILLYNYYFTGSPFEMLYKYHTFGQHGSQYGFILPSLKALWGLSFSWYRGMFFFTPFLFLLFLPTIREFILKNFRFLLNNYLVLPAVIYFLFMTSFFAWWGGWTYGPRFLTGVVLLIIYEGTRYISQKGFSQTSFFMVTAFGLLCAIMAKITIAYSAPSEELNPVFNLIVPALLKGNFNPNNVLTLLFNVHPKHSALAFIFLFVAGTGLLTLFYQKLQKQS